jgi:trans-2,3-dihydro-3-hydroxyanthranilate isomerase
MKAGLIPVSVAQSAGTLCFTLRANSPVYRTVSATTAQLASMLGLQAEDIAAPPLWVNTGSEQLVVPLRSAEAVLRCKPVAALFQEYAYSSPGRCMAYVWAPQLAPGSPSTAETEASLSGAVGVGAAQSSPSLTHLKVRFFFTKDGSIVEDPATGSACANLGGYLLHHNAAVDRSYSVLQGAEVQRPSRLLLRLRPGEIFVSGEVIELGRGHVTI